MKKFIVFSLLCLTTYSVDAQKVNEKVEIEHNGSWYKGSILKIKDNQYFITYDGWGESWNEWVSLSQIRGYATVADKLYKVGDRVEVEYGFIPEPATIIEVGENKYHIQFDKKAFGDKWVVEGQIKKL